MRLQYLFLTAILFTLFSCLSDQFLLENMTKEEKSNILTERGIEKYNAFFNSDQDLSKLDGIKKYFTSALDYNSENAKAKNYLKRIVNFKDAKVKEYIRLAQKYKAVQKRTESDDFTMCYYIEKALEIDPQNKDALKFKNDNKDVFAKLISAYSDRGNKAKDDSAKEKNEAKKKKFILAAIDNYGKILLLDKNNSKAKSEKSNLESGIKKDMQILIAKTNEELAKNNFKVVKDNIAFLKESNKSLTEKLDSEIANLDYAYNYKLAEFYYKGNKMDLAGNRIAVALSIKRTNEALNLNKVIQEKRNKAMYSESFDSTIESIDDLINDQQLVTAKQRIDYLYKNASAGQKKILDSKNDIINSKLDGIYNDAVNDYNNENFKGALQKFRTIVSINKDFKEAQKYYDKANEKQKTLDSF